MTDVCGYCGFSSIHSPECRELQAATGLTPRRMTIDEHEALERAYWKSVTVLDDGFENSAGEKP